MILCLESMRQIFSFCPKKIFHLMGLETIINLLYNHLEKQGESLDLDKKVGLGVFLKTSIQGIRGNLNLKVSEVTKTHRSTFKDLRISDFVDIDSLYDITKSNELVIKFGRYIEHDNLQDCQSLLKSADKTPNSLRRKTQCFFLSINRRVGQDSQITLGGKRVSLVELQKETCNPEDYLNIWLGIESRSTSFEKSLLTRYFFRLHFNARSSGICFQTLFPSPSPRTL